MSPLNLNQVNQVDFSNLVGISLLAIVLLSTARLAWQLRAGTLPWPRFLLRFAGQAASAALLYFVLFPPLQPGHAGALVVLTAGAGMPANLSPGDMLVVVPEAGDVAGAERVPDLGTALRRHAGHSPVRVLGLGLPARDHDAARGVALAFEPAPLPEGLQSLEAPASVVTGRQWEVRGLATGLAGGRAELRDPADEVVARAALNETGGFTLATSAGLPGQVDYTLQLRGADDTVAQSLALPLQVRDAAPRRILLLAGGASPEVKYLRRWAVDAGLRLHSVISLGGGVELGDPPLPITAAALAEFDLVLLDDRAWRDLGEGGRATLKAAVRDGLGVLLRITGELTATDRTVLRTWGLQADTADIARGLRLPGTEHADATLALDAETRAADVAPLLSRRPLALSAADGAVLLRAGDEAPLALWRAEGRGRVALWTLSDSYRLWLAGRRSAYGQLWANAVDTLARGAEAALPELPTHAWLNQRVAFCGLPDGARVRAPDGAETALLPDPTAGDARCAAFWPTQPGRHAVLVGDQAWPLLVRDPAELPAMAARENQLATLALVNAGGATAANPAPVPGPRWPWFVAWLLLSSALWWLERRRAAAT
ncbi:carboxypeptidase regulatory-like domain-containing protein [Arenimonas sp.]|uniref:carboxypeptidase regulatory-like domain-containing protein n=1 Tax=Arenimonas sp. TaxID=1872635 RepID=UPI0035B27282